MSDKKFKIDVTYANGKTYTYSFSTREERDLEAKAIQEGLNYKQLLQNQLPNGSLRKYDVF